METKVQKKTFEEEPRTSKNIQHRTVILNIMKHFFHSTVAQY